MASSNDFTANQIRVAKLILTGTQPGDGGIGVRNIGLAVYDESLATNQTGGISDANIFDSAGTDVAIFVSGSQKSRGTNANSGDGVFLLGGDSYISGTLVVENAGRTHGSISGSIQRMADGRSYLVAGSNITISSASDGQVTITGGAGDDGMGSGFVLEDDDGTEVTITEFKEVKFIGAGGIVTNWTDVSNGTDIDPYDLTFTAADLTFAGDGGSNQALTLGDTFTIEGGTNVTTAMTTDKVTINATDTNTQNTTTLSFVDSSDDIILRNTTGGATSSTDDITFVAGSNITLTYTDADNITIASSGGASTIIQTSVYSLIGGFSVVNSTDITHLKDDISTYVKELSDGTNQTVGTAIRLNNSNDIISGFIFRTQVPAGATKIQFTINAHATGDSAFTRDFELLVSGRKFEQETTTSVQAAADQNDAGKNRWLNAPAGADPGGDFSSAWRGFTSSTQTSNKFAMQQGPRMYIVNSREINLSDLINDSSSTIAAGDVLDIAIARNASTGTKIGTSVDSGDSSQGLIIHYVRVNFKA